MIGSLFIARARTRLILSDYPNRYTTVRRVLSRQKSISTPSSASHTPAIPIPKNPSRHRRLSAFLGIGLTTAFAVHSFSSYTIYGDAKHNSSESAEREQNDGGKAQTFNPYNFETVVEADGDTHIEFNPSPGIWRRDSFQLGR